LQKQFSHPANKARTRVLSYAYWDPEGDDDRRLTDSVAAKAGTIKFAAAHGVGVGIAQRINAALTG
jgi:hypothetical protein